MSKSVKGVARRMRAEEKRAVKTRDKKLNAFTTKDSFQNFAAGVGIGTDNLSSASGYGFNPITRERTLLEWIHRGSWIGGMAVDVIADDMTKLGVELQGSIDPEDIEHLDRAATTYNIWGAINDTIKWSRLYGGALGVLLIDGQAMETPLRIETVSKGQFKGMLALDRWMVEPSLNNLVTEYGPSMGCPKFYRVNSDGPGLAGKTIHYSRCLRLEGIRLPYWQRVMENLWGISVIERLFDRLVAFDSASTGMAQLVYKAWIRTYGIKGFRELIAAGGQSLQGVIKQVQMMRAFGSSEGITLIDAEDEYAQSGFTGFAGLAECVLQAGQQLSGAMEIPLVRLFGQSPAGLNSTGESDLRMYYDGINMRQEHPEFKGPVTSVYRVMAQSEGVNLPEGFAVKFKPLWQLTDAEKSEIAARDTDTVTKAFESGVIDNRGTCLEELKQSSRITGRWTNIPKGDVEAAKEEPAPALRTALEGAAAQEMTGGLGNGEPGAENDNQNKNDKKTKDSMLGQRTVVGIPVVIEYERDRKHPADYGYIQRTNGADGMQVDVMIGRDANSQKIFIVDSYFISTCDWDEHKVMLHYDDAERAMLDFRFQYPERKGFINEVGHAVFFDWLKRGNLARPYQAPTNVHYAPQAKDRESCCAACGFFLGGVCGNGVTKRDPKVVGADGLAHVSPTGWCEEFEKQ